MSVGDKVQIKGTHIIGKITAIGKCGLVQIISNSIKAFDRTIYYPEELEKVGGIK